VFFDHVPVPVENVLGEIGRGHIIAFNVLNIGRLKIGPFAVGASKDVLAICIQYAKERKAFGSPIAEFGAIQHKLAEMALRIFAVESMYWRVVGLIGDAKMTALEVYAVECSIVKVFASEAVGYVVDEGVQIHGGYGYHQDYGVERAYRDARIFRIFEGTNEINRQLIVNMLLKREAQGRLDLRGSPDSPALTALRDAREKYGDRLAQEQEVVMAIADRIIDMFARQSVQLRTQKLQAAGKGSNAADMSALLLGGAADGIALRRNIARRLLHAGRYVV
jgi:hypothetical protein